MNKNELVELFREAVIAFSNGEKPPCKDKYQLVNELSKEELSNVLMTETTADLWRTILLAAARSIGPLRKGEFINFDIDKGFIVYLLENEARNNAKTKLKKTKNDIKRLEAQAAKINMELERAKEEYARTA